MRQLKNQVSYSEGHADSRCAFCRYFVTTGDCWLVDPQGVPTPGRIDAMFWCELFESIKSHE